MPSAAEEWARVTPLLLTLGVVHFDLDRQVIAAYCDCVGDAVDLRKSLRDGTQNATVPALALLRGLAVDAARFAGMLGLSPKSRKTLNAAHVTLDHRAVAESLVHRFGGREENAGSKRESGLPVDLSRCRCEQLNQLWRLSDDDKQRRFGAREGH